MLFLTKSPLYLLLLERGYLAGEPLGVLGSPVVGELLLHVGHDLVLQLQTHGALFLQLPPLIVHFSLVGAGFLEGKIIGEWKVIGAAHLSGYMRCTAVFVLWLPWRAWRGCALSPSECGGRRCSGPAEPLAGPVSD